MIEALHLTRRFERRAPGGSSTRLVEAVRDVSLCVREGDRLGVVGESGSGKTTLAYLLFALTKPTSGTCLFRGTPYDALSREGWTRFRSECRFLFQNPAAALNPLFRVREVITEPIHARGRARRGHADARLQEVLERTRSRAEWLDLYPHQLSGGELRRVALARALVVPPSLLVADEPVAGLDVVLQSEIVEILREAVGRDVGSLVVISHDLAIVERLTNEILVMAGGEVVERLPRVAERHVAPTHPVARALFAGSMWRRAESAAVEVDGSPSSGTRSSRVSGPATEPPGPSRSGR